MKLITTLLIALFISDTIFADSFETDGHINIVAKNLHYQLPNYAVDKLIQAKRDGTAWQYSFWIEVEKTWVTEVRVNLKQINSYTTEVEVDVVKISGGLFFSNTKKQNDLTKLWSDKVSEILKIRSENYKAIAQTYIDATREAAENGDVEALQESHEKFLCSEKGYMLTSSRIWNYKVEENHGLLLTYQGDKVPALIIAIKRVTNELTVHEIDGHIIVRYYDRQPDGELGPLNYHLEFINENQLLMN